MYKEVLLNKLLQYIVFYLKYILKSILKYERINLNVMYFILILNTYKELTVLENFTNDSIKIIIIIII